ncbi:methyl-accepting chemotaxis protein [Sulfuricurvum sp.]|uniref:methyl-accepting chemotaxis protein n=1 Tax=Sulfuricurvum sp. TaxID=2025608 RepID=UPI003567D5DB
MNWLEKMVLRSKLVLLTAFMMVALLAIGAITLNSVNLWKAEINEIGVVRVPSLLGLMDMRAGAIRVALQQNRVRGLLDDPARSGKIADAVNQINKAWTVYERGYKLYAPLPQTPEEAIQWKEFEANFAEWRDMSKKIQNEVIEPLTHNTNNDPEVTKIIYDKMTVFIEESRKIRDAYSSNLDNIIKINADVADASVAEAVEKSSSAVIWSSVILSVSLLVAIILSILIIRSITRSIQTSVASIRDGAMQITSASDQVASSSSSLAQGASEQASSVEEVSATLEESTAINTQNTDNARQADILARNANDSARSGYEKGEQLSRSMHAITESAAKISGIIKTIDQIAFQTNLLALNAAVEAARAGEHGLGFAVVADEVRNLAQRAASAAKETSVIIEEVVGQIKEGNEIALATHTSFQEIVEQSKKVSDLIGEIAIAGKEQAEGMTQINQAMGQVDQVTQQVAANSEEAAAAAEELNAQATAMMETVRILAAMVGMESDASSHAPRKVNLHHLDPNPVIVHRTPSAQRKVISSASKAENIFPLSEDDLKEF